MLRNDLPHTSFEDQRRLTDVRDSVLMSALPPLDQPVAWVVVHGHEQVGPYALDVLIDEVIAERLADTTPVWWPPLGDWTTIRNSSELVGEIERRRRTDAPGWAPVVTGDAEVEGSGPEYPGAGVADATVTEPEVEVIDFEVLELEPTTDPDSDDDEAGIVDAVITSPIVTTRRTDTVLVALVDRSRSIAERLEAISEADDLFVSTMVTVGDAHGLSFSDHHSGPDEHRINLRDQSGDRELTVLLGRVPTGVHDVTVDPVLPLSMVLSVRGLVPSATMPDTGRDTTDEHGSIVIAVDERSGRLTGRIALFLATPDYVDDTLTVDVDRLYRDLERVVAALDASLIE